MADDTRVATIFGKKHYYRRGADGKWREIPASQANDHRTPGGGGPTRVLTKRPTRTYQAPGFKRENADGRDDDDDEDDDDDQELAGDYLGADDAGTPDPETLDPNESYYNKAKGVATKAGTAAAKITNPSAYDAAKKYADAVKDSIKKAATPPMASPALVMSSITPMELLVGALVVFALVKGRRRR